MEQIIGSLRFIKFVTDPFCLFQLDSSVFKSSEPTNVFNIDVSSTNFLNALKYAGIALLCFIIIGIALELTRLWMKRKKMRDGADREGKKIINLVHKLAVKLMFIFFFIFIAR